MFPVAAIGSEVFDRIEQSGGWRLIMQGNTSGFDVAARLVTPAHAKTHPVTYLGIAFHLAKRGDTRLSRLLVDDFVRLNSIKKSRASAHNDAELTLVDTHIRVYEDRELGNREALLLESILQRLPPGDHLGRALAMNLLCTVCLHLGEFNRTQGYAESAMRAYVDGAAQYGALHLHTHLGQIRVARGDLSGAEQEYQRMEEGLAALDRARPGLVSICKALRSEVAYEMNDLNGCRALLNDALCSVEDHDAWLDILAAVYRVNTRLALLNSGIPGALSALAHAERIADQRGMPRLRRLMRVEKIRALTLCDEIELAREEIKLADLDRFINAPNWDDEADWAMRQGSTAVALARFLVRAGRARQALEVLSSAEDRAIRGGQMLAVAKLRIIRALALWRNHMKHEGVAALVGAVRLLGNQPFRRFILDEGPELQQIIQLALDGDHAEARSNPQLRNRLSELNHQWAVHENQPAHAIDNLSSTVHDPGYQSGNARYLQLMAVGLSNKEIGRTLGVSENTVKYHLKNIFRHLRVSNRARAVNRARELGII